MKSKICAVRCEYFKNPLGIGTAQPRFDYRIESSDRNVLQTQWRIVAAADVHQLAQGNYSLWDSGWQTSRDTAQLVWQGARLCSRQRCWYQIYVTLSTGELLQSEVAWFETGLLQRRNFCARFVAPRTHEATARRGSFDAGQPAPMLRKVFSLPETPVQARLYCTALGLYNARVNGKQVTQNRLTPGWTNYDKALQYQTYDVTSLLAQGQNCIAAVLGEGWYCGCVGLAGRGYYNSAPPAFYSQLEMQFSNGTSLCIGTDDTWKYSYGPLRENDLILGETYDATRELSGWDAPNFDDCAWDYAVMNSYSTASFHGDFVAQSNPPICIKETREARSIEAHGQGMWIADMGQNMTGWVRLRVHGAVRGQAITLRFGEMCNTDGSLYTENLRFAKATDTYICKGEQEEYWEPLFTFHGFQFVEITGLLQAPLTGDIVGCVAYSDLDVTGNFVCGSEKVNQLFSNILWGQKGNFLDVPTDCPQRDERLGWTGDANVFCRSACYNMDAASFWSKWLMDLNTSQRLDGSYPDTSPYVNLTATAIKHTKNADSGNPVWADAGISVPYTLYQFYADKQILRRYYGDMLRYMDFLEQDSENGLRGNFGYGDWLNVNDVTPNSVIGTAFYAYDAKLMAHISEILGETQQQARFAALHAFLTQAFCNAFVHADGTIEGDTQTAYLLALDFALVQGALAQRVAQQLVRTIQAKETHLSCGFVGIRSLLPVLTRYGQRALAYDLLLQETYPSWLYSVNNGATTVWERWNSYTHEAGFGDVGMNSFNHYSLGSVVEWMYAWVGGIQPEGSGFQALRLCPVPDARLGFATVQYRAQTGTIVSAWQYEADCIAYSFEIPANCTAHIVVPRTGAPLTVEGAMQTDMQTDRLHFYAGSGACRITIQRNDMVGDNEAANHKR